ncbi:MAG: hypothetical protein WD066_00535 [Planctomycetaceae bacterium]
MPSMEFAVPHPARSALEEGERCARAGRLREAIDRFADALAQSNGSPMLRSAACTNLAAVHREACHFGEAAAWQQVALSASADARPSDRDPAGCDIDPADLAGLANDALLRGEHHLAEKLLSLSLAAEFRRGNLRGVADDLGGLGVVLLSQGRRQPALAKLWRAYRLHRRLDDEAGAGRDLLNLAELCRRANRPRIAFRCLRHAIRRFDRCGAAHLVERARVLLDDAVRIAEVRLRNPLSN